MEPKEFLAALFGSRDGYVEFRLIGRGKALQKFYTLREVLDNWTDLSKSLTAANSKGANVYFGALLRTEAKGDADHVEDPCILWADIDSKDAAVNDHFAPILAAGLTPSIIVDSGHGYHCYWLLREAIPKDRATNIMDAIARVVDGDKVSDPPRILRVPGFHNVKREPAVPCVVIRADLTRVYNASDFDPVFEMPACQPAPAAPPAAPAKVKTNGSVGGYLLPIAKMLSPYWGNGTRHKVAMGLAGLLKRNDIDRETARKVIEAITKVTGDDEPEDRLRAVESTYDSSEIVSTSILDEVLDEQKARSFLSAFNAAVALIPPPPVHRSKFPAFKLEEVASPDSLVYQYILWATRKTDAPIEFHVASFITLCAAVIGNKVSLPFHGHRSLFANLYTLLTAPSSRYRKSTSIGMVRAIGKAIQLPTFPSNATAEALYTLLAPEECEWREEEGKKGAPPKQIPIAWKGRPFGIIYHPEFASYLDVTSKSYMADIRSMMTDYYDGQVDATTGSRQTKTAGKYYVTDPALSMLCASTPVSVQTFLGRAGMLNGFLTRFLLVMPSPSHSNQYLWPGDQAEDSAESADQFNRICERLSDLMRLQGVMQIGRAAKDVLMAFDAEIGKKIKECEGSQQREMDGLLARLPQMAIKVAMVYGAFHAPLMEITEEDARYATGLIRHSANTLPHIHEWIKSDEGNREVRWRNRVLEVARGIVARTGPTAIRHRQLLQNSNLDAEQFKRAISSLVAEGRMLETSSGPRGAKSYTLNEVEG